MIQCKPFEVEDEHFNILHNCNWLGVINYTNKQNLIQVLKNSGDKKPLIVATAVCLKFQRAHTYQRGNLFHRKGCWTNREIFSGKKSFFRLIKKLVKNNKKPQPESIVFRKGTSQHFCIRNYWHSEKVHFLEATCTELRIRVWLSGSVSTISSNKA